MVNLGDFLVLGWIYGSVVVRQWWWMVEEVWKNGWNEGFLGDSGCGTKGENGMVVTASVFRVNNQEFIMVNVWSEC